MYTAMISLKYFDLIGLDTELKQKADQIKNRLAQFNGFTPQKVYVSEFLRSDQTKVFENIVFISGKIICEVRNFAAEEKYVFYKTDHNVATVQVMKHDHDFQTFESSSRIHVRIAFRYGTDLVLKGSGENCRFLMDLLNTVFLADLYDSSQGT
jgi:hypothetical protein